MNVIGKLLRKYRIEKNLSYLSTLFISKKASISIHKQCLYDIENNRRTVKDYELFGIAYVLDIDVNDLFKDIKNKILL